MHTKPDGVEVVLNNEQARQCELPPLLILENIERYLDQLAIGAGPISWQRIGDGQSNITFLLSRDERRVVLRRGPRPPIPKGAHDMIREARIQEGLARVDMPVPKILAVEEDESYLGVPFYLMEFLEGVILLDESFSFLDTPLQRARLSEVFVDTLADLHQVDLEAAGLRTLAKPEGYLERQISTFDKFGGSLDARELPLIHELASQLSRKIPTSQGLSLVHGDYRLGNIMFHPEAPPRVLAIMDWEMATLGDPLADLGYLLATYSDPTSPGTVMEFSLATRETGYFDRQELVSRYQKRFNLDISDIHWYECLALWKSAVFCEAIYERWLRGERPDDQFGPILKDGVIELLEVALDTLSRRRG